MKSRTILAKFIVFAVLIFSAQNSFSQENYLTGYIISLNRDTLRGFIDYRKWDGSTDKVFFKEKITDKRVKYKPIDIREFVVADEIFVSAIVNTEVSPSQTNALEYDAALQIETDTTFLQTIVKGKKCLYYFRNNFGNDQFYIKQDTAFELLVYKAYLKDVDGLTGIAENRKYMNQLMHYFNDCSTIRSKIMSTPYTRENLEKIFDFYYNCSHSTIKFQKKAEKIQAQFGILAGVSLTSLSFSGDYFSILSSTVYPQSVNFTGGIFLEVILPGHLGKWSICNELNYSSWKTTGILQEYKDENRNSTIYTNFGCSYLKMNNMVRFKYPIFKKLFVFVDAGISNGYAFRATNSMKTETRFFSTTDVWYSLALEAFKKYEFGLLLGAGLKYKKMSLETRYEYGNGISNFLNLHSEAVRYHFMLGYRF